MSKTGTGFNHISIKSLKLGEKLDYSCYKLNPKFETVKEIKRPNTSF